MQVLNHPVVVYFAIMTGSLHIIPYITKVRLCFEANTEKLGLIILKQRNIK